MGPQEYKGFDLYLSLSLSLYKHMMILDNKQVREIDRIITCIDEDHT